MSSALKKNKETSKNFTKNISVVLVEPEHPNNVGAVARAMNNMGFTKLILIKPCDYLSGGNDGARTLAMHSQDILQSAKVYSDLRSALLEQNFVIALTNRVRGQHKILENSWNLEYVFKQIQNENNIALVFGRESSGLTNSEVDLCDLIMTIPTFGQNTSLNLSQAVMVILYEISKTLNKQESFQEQKVILATSRHIESLKHNLFSVLERIGYIKIGNESKRWSVFSKLISEKYLSEKEVNILQGVLNKIKENIK